MKLPEIKPSSYGDYVFGYDRMEAYGQACYQQAILDAMNATRSFGKTGEAMALTIQQLARDEK